MHVCIYVVQFCSETVIHREHGKQVVGRSLAVKYGALLVSWGLNMQNIYPGFGKFKETRMS